VSKYSSVVLNILAQISIEKFFTIDGKCSPILASRKWTHQRSCLAFDSFCLQTMTTITTILVYNSIISLKDKMFPRIHSLSLSASTL
jgi:hypothetical protein